MFQVLQRVSQSGYWNQNFPEYLRRDAVLACFTLLNCKLSECSFGNHQNLDRLDHPALGAIFSRPDLKVNTKWHYTTFTDTALGRKSAKQRLADRVARFSIVIEFCGGSREDQKDDQCDWRVVRRKYPCDHLRTSSAPLPSPLDSPWPDSNSRETPQAAPS